MSLSRAVARRRRRCARARVLAGAAALAALACGVERRAEPASVRRPDVVLVVIDTLRADALGFLGSPHGSEHLDRLAAEGVVFTQAISPSTWTLPAMASLVTSLHPSEHGLLGGGEKGAGQDRMPQSLDEDYLTLAEAFERGGYRTVGVVNQVYLTWKYGFGQGFDRYAAVRGFDGQRINRRVERELDALGSTAGEGSPLGDASAGGAGGADSPEPPATPADDAPIFLYVHYLDPHWPYRHRTEADRAAPPPALAAADDPELELPRGAEEIQQWVEGLDDPELRRRALDSLAARYALEVRWVDVAVAGLIDLLQRRGRWDDAVLVVTSDHGEAFWEHERLLHGHSPHEELVRVPLLIRTPKHLGFSPARRTAQVSLVDLMPTLLELAGLPACEHCRGRSLVPAMRGDEDPDRAVLIETGWERALRTRDGKLLVRGVGAGRSSDAGEGVTVEYYDLAADPGERRNLAAPCAGPCRESVRRLQEIERGLQPRAAHAGEVTPEEIEELRALGYVGD